MSKGGFAAGLEGVLAVGPAQGIVIRVEWTRLTPRAIACKIRDEVFGEQNACGKEQLAALAQRLLPRLFAYRIRAESRSPAVILVSSGAEAELIQNRRRKRSDPGCGI